MTLIEFFEKTDIENIACVLLCAPEKVIYVGSSASQMKDAITRYRAVAAGRGINADFSFVRINRNDIFSTRKMLAKLVENNPGCVFDLTGGEDLTLTAAGAVFEQYRGSGLQMQRLNINTGVLTDCDGDGEICGMSRPYVTVRENIGIYGGRIMSSGDTRWSLDRGLRADLLDMWGICCRDPGGWNSRLNVISRGERGTDEPLTARLPEADADSVSDLLDSLEAHKLITYKNRADGMLTYSYKSQAVRQCIGKAGQILELIIYLTACEAVEGDGRHTYDDVMTGVSIEWNGSGKSEVWNEIDVMMTGGLVPVFVSCKNGIVDSDELHKLNSVASRFGGKYAKKVIVISDPSKIYQGFDSFRARADEMGIRVVDDLRGCGGDEIKRLVKSFLR